jgi:hypothetical protein
MQLLSSQGYAFDVASTQAVLSTAAANRACLIFHTPHIADKHRQAPKHALLQLPVGPGSPHYNSPSTWLCVLPRVSGHINSKEQVFQHLHDQAMANHPVRCHHHSQH